MAKLTRFVQKVFGSAAGASQIAKFGSLAAGSPAFTTDPAVIQSLGNYLTGWFGAVVGPNAPAIEDMNALCYLFAYQLTYLMQTGVAEWDATTTYFIGSVVNDGFGKTYTSITDNNLNNVLTDTANWHVTATGPYNKIIGTGGYATFAAAGIASGDCILVTSDVTVAAQVLISAADVQIDFLPGKRLISSNIGSALLNITGNRFRSNNLSIKATGAITVANNVLAVQSDDSIISALFIELSNAGIAITNVIKFTGNRSDITSGSIVATSGSYTNPYNDSGTNNDARIRG